MTDCAYSPDPWIETNITSAALEQSLEHHQQVEERKKEEGASSIRAAAYPAVYESLETLYHEGLKRERARKDKEMELLAERKDRLADGIEGFFARYPERKEVNDGEYRLLA